MCRDVGMDDFRIFGALYQIRHGIELWLKCISRNVMIDRALASIFRPESSSFEEVVEATQQTSKHARQQLRKAVCVLRNVLEDRVVFPDCHRVRIDDHWANKALAFMREH